ncbi:Z-ring formation inhibitor MciZ [Chengkuizengella sediminis]|uniref:Z-ring formation inhibitor MciZ n=1 Tax=Chengkuizengella sediminis TaxID=1885917 RepID=UPI00138943B9|nr:Z-ring formation inhibitor MciZ [Chengkuizengella sediminis]
MKSYILKNQIKFVGKAWEIRSHLNSLLKQSKSQHITLLDYLNSITPAAQHSKHLVQHNKPQEKNKDHRVIPFPST